MGRYFASSAYGDVGAPSVLDIANNATMAMSAWVYAVTSLPVNDSNIMSKGYDGTNTAYALQFSGSTKIAFISYNGSVHGASWTYSGLSADAWFHVYGDYDGSTWHLDVNGAQNVATSVDAIGPISTTKKFYLAGQDANGTPSQFFDPGQLAECAVWNTNLSVAERVALANGYSPAFIRPASLLAYWPLKGVSSPEQELINGNAATITGGTSLHATAGPRIIMPSSQRMRRMTTAAGAATFPWAWAQGSNLPVLGTGNY